MRIEMRILLILSLVFLPIVAQAQTPPSAVSIVAPGSIDFAAVVQTPMPVFQIGQPLVATWAANTNEVTEGVSVYRFRLDNLVVDHAEPVGRPSYRYVIPQGLLTAGGHTAGIRACRPHIQTLVIECGDEGTIVFVVDRPLPARPTLNIAPVTPDMALNRNEGERLVQAYARVAIMRELNKREMDEVERRYGNNAITREGIFRVMDPWFLEVAR
jgi:hypothetical protein